MAQNEYAATTYHSHHWIVRYPHQRRFSLAARAIEPADGMRILDYGAGDGHLFNVISEGAPAVRLDAVGYEPVRHYAALFARNCRSTSQMAVRLVTSLIGLTSHSFDVITCMSVLEHLPLPERQRFYDHCEHLLKPEGRIVLEVPVEIGPSVLVKDVGRKVLKQRDCENPPRQLVSAGVGRTVFDPARFDSQSRATWIQGHRGFDYRLLASELAFRFNLLDRFAAPLSWVPPWLGNQEVFFICRPQTQAERARRHQSEDLSSPK